MFQIQSDFQDEVFMKLCKQGALVITSDKNKEIIAIITNKSIKEIQNALIASHGYGIGFLSNLQSYIIYPFVSDVIQYKCDKMIRDSIKSWVQDWSV